jgi:hypothetical protein
MAALQAAIMENERTVLPPTFTQNVSQMNSGVPVIKGNTDIPVGKAVENPGYTTREPNKLSGKQIRSLVNSISGPTKKGKGRSVFSY